MNYARIDAVVTWVYAAGFGGGFAPGVGQQVIAVIDPATNTPIDSMTGITGTVYSAFLAPDDSTLFIGSAGHLAAVNVKSKTVMFDMPVNGLVLHLAPDLNHGRLYATVWQNYREGSVEEFDASTLAPLRTIVAASSGAQGIALRSDGGRLFVVTEFGRVLSCTLDASVACNSVQLPNLLSLNAAVVNSTGTDLYVGFAGMVFDFDPLTLRLKRTVVLPGSLRFAVRAGVPVTAVLGGGVTLLP